MILDRLKAIVRENPTSNPLYLRNLLKESLQDYVLNYVYNFKWGESFLLKGGSCLRMFFGLPRLSEDLDLDILNPNSFVLKDFVTDLENYFSRVLQYRGLGIRVSSKENIIYLKFPILDELGLVKSADQTRILFLRIDLTPVIGKKYKAELSLRATPDFSFLVKRYSIEDLFSGKIAAILQRTSLGEPRVKGRDYFDLAWFLEKKVTPNFAYLQEIAQIKTKKELGKKLKNRVENLDLVLVKADLMPLFQDSNFVENFVRNYKNLAARLLCGIFGHRGS